MVNVMRIKTKYTRKELENLPTLAQGQVADLKIDNGKYRIWLCRVTGTITHEAYINGKWEIVHSY